MSIFFGFQGNGSQKKKEQNVIPVAQNTVATKPVSGMTDTDILRVGADCLSGGDVDRALILLKEGARRGNGQCALMIHDYLTEKEYDEENRFFWARFAADAHIAMGEYYVARYYLEGSGVTRNREKAFGFAEAAMRHASEVERTRIIETYRELEEIFFPSEERKEQFYTEKLEELTETAKASGEEKDYIRLAIYIKCFLPQNIGVLFFRMGNLFETGKGVRMDLAEAIRLYSLAEANGYQDEDIEYRRRQLRSRIDMNVNELWDNANKAYSVVNNDPYIVFSYVQYTYFQRLGAEKNSYKACFQYAMNLARQCGVKRDYDESLFYFKKVRALTDENPNVNNDDYRGLASKRLSFMYSLGQGVTSNPVKANYYFSEAKKYMDKPDRENSVEEFILKYGQPVAEISDKRAEMLWEGHMCTPDVTEAMQIYRQKKTVQSVKMLSWIYAAGYDLGMKPDYEQSMQVFQIFKKHVRPTSAYYAWQAGILLAVYNHQFMDTASVFQVHHATKLIYFAIRNNLNCLKEELCSYLSRVGYSDPAGLCRSVQERINQEEIQKKTQENSNHKESQISSKEILRQMLVETEEKMRNPETQNAQMKPEIKAKDTEHSWPEVEEILQLEKEEKWEELIELGWEYYDRVSPEESEEEDKLTGESDDKIDKEQTVSMDGIYAALCFQTAAVHGNVTGLFYLLSCFTNNVGLPQDPFLVKKIVERLEKAGVNFEETDVHEWLDKMLEDVEDRQEYDWSGYGSEYLTIAEQLEQDHHSCMEWILYEYYRMATYHLTNNGMVTAKLRDKFYNRRVDWDQLLAMPWETILEKQEEERDRITVESLDTSESVREVGEDPMPENLDSYFEGMIGMEPVKAQLEKIYQAVKMQLLREEILKERGENIPENEKGYNFILLGNPGTGKTTVARIIAKILYDIKIRKSDSFLEIERSKVVSDHIGGTENRMREILQKVDGGTLFIDEAYALYREDSDNDFGQEAIDVLMKDMEDHRDSYSVIMAGYKLPMENMIRNANSGFSSRFSYKIELPDYSDESLVEMAHAQIEKQQFTCEEDVDIAIVRCIAHDKLDETFGNARYIRELVNRAIENQAERLSGQTEYDKKELFVLKACDFWQGYVKEKGVKEYLEELNSLCGLASVKSEVNSLINMLNVQKEMQRRGLLVAEQPGTLHMAFKGNPGTGKTTVARLLGKLYAACGVLKRGDVFIECNRANLVAAYQGQTADKVKKVVQSALGGILFIDEAYSLVQSENDSFGMEALNELMAEMENYRDSLIVIFAGYKDDIDKLFEKNPGLRSRVPRDLIFEDYSLEELNRIALDMLRSQKLLLAPEAEETLRELLSKKVEEKDFSNARGVRNTVERMKRNQAERISKSLMNGEAVSDEMLLTITEEDIKLVE